MGNVLRRGRAGTARPAAGVCFVWPGVLTYVETTGEHAWKYWQRWLAGPHLDRHLMNLEHATATPIPHVAPTGWRFSSVATHFDVWDYSFDVAPGRAREFLAVSDVDPGGLTLTGSGSVTVTTAPIYTAGGSYVVEGAPVTADQNGRLRFVVDLGAPHTDEQFTPAARAGMIAGPYFTTAHVTIEPGP